MKTAEKMNKPQLREQQQQQEKISLETNTTTATTSNNVTTCPPCSSTKTEGSKYCSNCGLGFADASKEEEGTIIKNQNPTSPRPLSVSVASSAPPSRSTIKNIEKNVGKFKTSKLSAYGVKINHPSKWEIDRHPEPPNFIIFKSPREDSSDTYLESVAISSYNITNETPEQVMQGAVIALERDNPDFTLIESVTTILAGRQAHRIVCDFGGQRYLSIVTIEKGIAYQISYVAEPSKYDIYLPIVQKMLDSLEINKK